MASPIDIIKSCTRDISSGSKSKRNEALSRLKNLLTERLPFDDAEAGTVGQSVETPVWTRLIVCLHMALTVEMDPYQRPNDKNAAVLKCEELLRIIDRRISCGYASVVAKDLIPCILEVLRNGHYRGLLASTYLHLALTLLNMKKYLFAIGFTLLKDLADKCMQLMKNRNALPFEDQLLMVLIIVSRHSCNDTQLEFHLRMKFSFLLELFNNREADGSLKQKMLIELAVIFCLQFGKDRRTEACEFGEKVVNKVLNYPLFKPASSKMPLQSLFLYLQMILHHPLGVRMEANGFYAKDLNTWKETITLLYEYTCDRIEEMSNLKPFHQEQFFIKFAAIVCNQVFDRDDQSNLEEGILIPKKRRKLNSGISLYDVAKKMREKWPWIQVLSNVVNLSQGALKREEYLPLLKLLLELQNTSKEEVLMDHVCGFFKHLLTMEHLLNANDKAEANETWAAVSATTIRMVGLNQHEMASHSLLQQLLIHRKVSKAGDLMVLFLQGIKYSESSLNTWITLFSGFNMFDKYNSQGRCNKAYFVCLLQWLSPHVKNMKMPISPKTVANAYLSLTCNEGVDRHTGIESNEQMHSVTYLEEVLMWSSLEMGSLIKDKDSRKPPCTKMHFTKDCDPNNRTLLVEILEKDANASIELMCSSSDNNLGNFKTFIQQMLILSTTLSGMVECHVLNDNDCDNSFERLKTSLSKMAKIAAKCATEYLDENFHLASQDNLIEFYGAVKAILSAKFVPSVLHIIQQECFYSLIARILELSIAQLSLPSVTGFDIEAGMTEDLRTDEEEHYMDLYEKLSFDEITMETCLRHLTIGRKHKVFYEALMVVASFASNHAEGKMLTDQQNKMIKKIIGFLDRANFQEFLGIGMNIMNNLIKCTSLTGTIVAEILIFMRRVCNEEFYSDVNVAAVLHLLLAEMLKYTSVKEVQVKMMMFLKLINNRIINKKFVGGKAILYFQKLLVRIIKADPSSSWAVCDAPPYETSGESGETDKYPFYTHILKYLNHNNQDVRMEATKCLSIIFKPNMMGIKAYKWLFEIFSEQLGNCFQIKDVPEGFQSVDESANRTAVVLQSWATVVAVSSFFRKKALFNLLKVERNHSVNIELMKRTVLLLTKQLKLQSVENMFVVMKQQMQYIITWWFHYQFDIKDFRWVLFGFDSGEEFFTEQVNVILPIMVQNISITDANLVVFGHTSEELLVNSAEYVIAACLPLLSNANNPEHCLLQNKVMAQHNYQCLTQILKDETIGKLFSEKSHKIFAEVLHLLHDPTHFFALCGQCSVILPEPELPCCDIQTVQNVLQFIQVQTPNICKEIICHWAINELSCIEKLLIMLEVQLQKMVLIEDRLKYLYQYCTYINFLALSLQKNSSEIPSNVAQYIIEIVTYRFMNLIDTQSEELPVAIAALNYYGVFCTRMLPKFHEVIGKLLNFLVSRIAPLAATNNDVSVSAVRLLQLLIVENETSLKRYIMFLDPLQKLEALQQVNEVQKKCSTEEYTLQETIDNFLLKVDKKGQSAEALIHLRIQLVSRKLELSQMYRVLHTKRGLSEDCAASAVHRLIYVLVQLSHSSRPEVSVEATKCLGELGPASLGTIVLQPDSTLIIYQIHSVYNADYRFVSHILTSVCEYLIESDVAALETASDILYKFVNTRLGKTILGSEQYKKENENKFLILPYMDITTSPLPLGFNSGMFETAASDTEIWCPQRPTGHEQWITTLTSKLLSSFISPDNSVTLLIKMCEMKPTFAENILPYVLSLIRGQCEDLIWGKIIKLFRTFFEKFFKNTVSNDGHKEQRLTDNGKIIHSNIVSMKCMLNAVQCLWINGIETSEKEQLNFIEVAQAALSCASFFTALQCAELWCIQELRETNSRKSVVKLDISQTLATLKERNKVYGSVVEKIFKQANANIGEVDAWHGCGRSHLQTPEGRRYHYEMKGEWDNVLLACEPQIIPFQKECVQNAYMRPLEHLGMFDLLYISSTIREDELEKHAYECMWRLGDWSHLGYCSKLKGEAFGIYQSYMEEANCFEELHYNALKAARDSNFELAKSFLLKARDHMCTFLRHSNTECCQNLYEPFSRLQLLNQIEDFIYTTETQELCVLIEKWSTKDPYRQMEIKYFEPFMSQRISLLKIVLEKEKNPIFQKELCRLLGEMHLEIGRKAHQEHCFNIAERQINSLHNALNVSQDTMLNALLEEAVLFWDKGQKEVGQYLLKKLISLLDKPLSNMSEFVGNHGVFIHAAARKYFGDWLVETGSGNSQVIIKDYYQKSLELMEKTSSPADKAAAYLALARFADALYQERVNYMSSAEFKVKQKLIEKAKALLYETKEQNRAAQMNRSMIASHSKELQDMEGERYVYLELALRSYLQSLELDDVNELQVFRFVSLWLENKFEERLSPVVETHLFKIPMHKLLPVLPQLVPHLNASVTSWFTVAVTKIIELVARQHPYHALPLIISVVNLQRDEKYVSCGSKSEHLKPRVEGAQDLLRRLQDTVKLHAIVNDMQDVFSVLIGLAYVAGRNPGRHPLPGRFLLALTDKAKVPVLTDNIPVRANSDYNNIVGIHHYEKTYEICGGIHAPKKLVCIGTDGRKSIQLIKGNDDLRQDAVMMQVFSIMNQLLKKNQETQKRKLHLRTYKIVPCSQLSGIIEWCSNTIPLGQYLQNKHGIDFKGASREMLRVVDKPLEERLTAFQNICESLEPVFHKFFLETYKTPGIWYERRLSYIRSVAVASMTGYILGIGDRHMFNILLDQDSGELIHIDFGIAYEQGKFLKIPEIVPFRLTRELEDGMGASGIEGVYRRCCEKTMEVLRVNKDTIYAIVEVLLYDPLYTWVLSSSRAQKAQSGEEQLAGIEYSTSSDVNIMAKMVLLKLKNKLQGTEEGTQKSVSGQVNKLVETARDPQNLCRMFKGWQPYL